MALLSPQGKQQVSSYKKHSRGEAAIPTLSIKKEENPSFVAYFFSAYLFFYIYVLVRCYDTSVHKLFRSVSYKS